MQTDIHYWSHADWYNLLITRRPIRIIDHMQTDTINVHVQTDTHYWSCADRYTLLITCNRYTLLITCRPIYIIDHVQPIHIIDHVQTDIHYWSNADRCTLFITCRPIYIIDHMQTDIHYCSHAYRYTLLITSDRYALLNISRSVLLRIRNVSEKKLHENQILCWINFFPRKSCRLWGNVEKYCRAGQTTDDNMAYAQCTVGT